MVAAHSAAAPEPVQVAFATPPLAPKLSVRTRTTPPGATSVTETASPAAPATAKQSVPAPPSAQGAALRKRVGLTRVVAYDYEIADTGPLEVTDGGFREIL